MTGSWPSVSASASCSAAARALFGAGEHLAFVGVVHNPIDIASIALYPTEVKEDYVAFVGRCHWEKGPVGAIQVALETGVPLKMALRVTDQERPYFDAVVLPALRTAGRQVEFVGEVGGAAKAELIGRARAVIFSSPWEEPFGLVLIEAGAHGTPVVALRRGAAPEIVTEGVTGYLADTLEELAQVLPAAMALDPAEVSRGRCRSVRSPRDRPAPGHDSCGHARRDRGSTAPRRSLRRRAHALRSREGFAPWFLLRPSRLKNSVVAIFEAFHDA